MNPVDILLYRPLKSGKEYEGLIPAYEGKTYDFDKETDNSTTYDTLRFMANWTDKYAYQMQKIAPLLKGNTVQETVNKIYKFLYNHFQYKLDGSLQSLYSPSAAWHFRTTGFDCKTYSLLAGTILKNLKINFSYRMVQQAGIMPGEWSHVYVVIPNGNSHYIIDATTHTNKEVSFTKKYDHTMTHRGLASPYTSALGCACQGNHISKSGLGSPAVLNNTIANFHKFLDEMEKQGVSREVTDKMTMLVRANVAQGIDPNMNEIIHKATAVPAGLGAGFTATPNMFSTTGFNSGSAYQVPTFNSYTPSVAMNTPSAFSQAFGQVKNAGASAIGNMSVMGVNSTTIMAAAAGDPMAMASAALTVLKKVIPIDKTFGQVFANGFNLSCWGSTVTPAIAKGWIANDLPMVYQQTLGQGVTQANLNLFIDGMNFMKVVARNWGAVMKKCSKEGLYQYADAAEKAKKQVIDELQKIVTLQPTTTVKVTQKLPFTFTDKTFNEAKDTFDSERYLIIFPNQAPPAQAVAGETVATVDGTATPVAKKSGISLIAIGSAALLAFKLLA